MTLPATASHPLIHLRPATERGHVDHGWLDTWHSFSFASYHDPAHMGFSALRVINEDWIAAGAGFGTHPHRDMEILTWVLEGALAHKDSTGGGGIIRPGELQRMSAGSGITHSEFNASETERVHLLQIWLLPKAPGLAPRYSQTAFPADGRRNTFQLLASPDGRDGSLDIHQEASLWVADLDAGQGASLGLGGGRRAWIQVANGQVRFAGHVLGAGDGAALEAVEGERALVFEGVASEGAQVLVFDLP